MESICSLTMKGRRAVTKSSDERYGSFPHILYLNFGRPRPDRFGGTRVSVCFSNGFQLRRYFSFSRNFTKMKFKEKALAKCTEKIEKI